VITIAISQSWATIRGGITPTALADLVADAPEPPFGYTSGVVDNPDYLRACGANLLYLEQALPDAHWEDPHSKLFEAKAYRFLAAIRSEGPGEFEATFPFKTKPDPFQLHIFTHARRLNEIALAPCALGTGKTKMTLDIAAAKFLAGEIDGIAVIAPNGVHRQWISEGIPAHMSESVPVRTHVWKPTTKIPREFPLNPRETVKRLRVVTFNVEAFSTASGKALKFLRALMQTGRWMLICDESTRIKNGVAERTKTIVNRLAPFSKVRMILTGTPVTKGLEDLYNQYRFLNPDILGLSSWTAFRNRYCVTVPAFRGAALGAVRIVGYKHQEEMFRKIAPVTFMVGSEVLGLGEPIKLTREVTLTGEQEEIYEAMASKLYEQLMAKNITTPQNTLVELLRLQQVLCGWVYETVVDEEGLETSIGRRIPSNRLTVLQRLLEDNEEPVVIWARFKPDIDDICEMLTRMDDASQKAGSMRRYRHVRYDGTVKSAERDAGKEAFRDGDVEYFVGNPAAGGTGVDGLQALCSLGVYYSNSYNREHRWQSEGRLFRRGQKRINGVRHLDLVAPGTVDGLFLKSYAATEQLANAVLRSPIILRGGSDGPELARNPD
jgi:hypothetical protein